MRQITDLVKQACDKLRRKNLAKFYDIDTTTPYKLTVKLFNETLKGKEVSG